MYSALKAKIDQWTYYQPHLSGKLSSVKETIHKRARQGHSDAFIELDFVKEGSEEFLKIGYVLETLGYNYTVDDEGTIMRVTW